MMHPRFRCVRLILLGGLLPLLLAAPFLAADKPPAQRPDPATKGRSMTRVRPAADKPPALHGYALLVGVNRYEKTQLTNLTYAEDDVTDLARVLRDAGYHRVVLMTTGRGASDTRYLPTAVNIRRELRGLLEDRREGDTVVVAFAGHGLEFAGSDEPYFCPMDARVRERTTLVSLGEVYGELKKCKAHVKVLLSDACRNDPLSRLTRAALSDQVFAPRSGKGRKPPENVVALFACSPGEYAHESRELKHGVFFYHVVKGLQGKAALPGGKGVTLGTLTDYVQRSVADYIKEELGPRDRQRPELVGRYSGSVLLTPLQSEDAVRPGWEREVNRLLRQGAFDKAESQLNVRLRGNPRQAMALALRAEARARQGKTSEALEDAVKASKLEPKLPRAHFSKGYVCGRLKRYDEALAAYSEALRLQPDYATAANNRGNIHYARKDYAKAVADYSLAIRLQRGYALAWYNRGCTYLEMKQFAQAIGDLTESLRLDPYCGDTHEARGRAYLGQGKADLAVTDFTQVLVDDPDNVELYELRAAAFDRLGKRQQAENDRRKARELKKKQGTTRD